MSHQVARVVGGEEQQPQQPIPPGVVRVVAPPPTTLATWCLFPVLAIGGAQVTGTSGRYVLGFVSRAVSIAQRTKK